jgi:hypothetical protein
MYIYITLKIIQVVTRIVHMYIYITLNKNNTGSLALHGRLVAGFSPSRPGFDPRSVYVEFVVDQVATREAFLPVLPFSTVSIISQMFHTYSFTYHRYTLLYQLAASLNNTFRTQRTYRVT